MSAESMPRRGRRRAPSTARSAPTQIRGEKRQGIKRRSNVTYDAKAKYRS